MVEIELETRRYARRNPYRFTRAKTPPSLKGDLTYAIWIDPPESQIATMLGDFIHNLRTALDHLIVACAPKERKAQASFPVVYKDIFSKDAAGNFIDRDDKARERFRDAIDGCDPDVIALVIGVQPYRQGAEADRNMFGALSRLDNADKHSALITTATGAWNVHVTLSVDGLSRTYPMTPDEGTYMENGAKISFGWEADKPRPEYSKVHMEGRGTPFITVEVSQFGGNQPPLQFPLRQTMLMALREVRAFLKIVEPFVKR